MDAMHSTWSDWIEAHGARAVLYARQWVPCQSDAEDIVQTAFLRFWPARQRAKDSKAYFYSCVRNAAIDWVRESQRRRKRDQSAAAEASESFEPSFERTMEQDEFRAVVESLMQRLPDEQRQVLVMKIWGQLTFAQIAEVEGISANTAASRYRYAVESLRQQMPAVMSGRGSPCPEPEPRAGEESS